MRFFYVDESGHTGTNLFDQSQPTLYYGVLSTNLNLDLLGKKYLPKIHRLLNVQRLHAAELGNGGLVRILPDLLKIIKKFKPTFDIYRVNKKDHALICFFDQVFDQGINPAVPWSSYWTPLRYVLLFKLTVLFDDDDLKEAWAIRIERNRTNADERLVNLCSKLLKRIKKLPDARSQEVIGEALLWARDNTNKLGYSAVNRHEVLSVAPNLVGFQLVMRGIANRIKLHKVRKPFIVVDQQSQFNTTQKSLAKFYSHAKASTHKFVIGPGMPEIDFTHMPESPIQIKAGNESHGLEIVDVYLWLIKRKLEGKEIAPPLNAVIAPQFQKGMIDELSLKSIEARWVPWFENLPVLSEEKEKEVGNLLIEQEKNRIKAIENS